MAFQLGLTIVYSHVHVYMQWELSYCWYLFASRIRVTSVYNIFTQLQRTNPPLWVFQNLKSFHHPSILIPRWFSDPKNRAASGRVISSSHLMTWVTGFQSPPGWHYLFCKGIPINYKPLVASATRLVGDPIDDSLLSQFEAVRLSLRKEMEQLNVEQRIFRNQRWYCNKCCIYIYEDMCI